jgi:hypothetical protein
MIGKKLNKIINNLIYTERGRILLSIIFGLGLASLFRLSCKDKDCYNFIGPKQNEIRDKIFSFDSDNSTCYKMREKNIVCGKKQKTINYS